MTMGLVRSRAAAAQVGRRVEARAGNRVTGSCATQRAEDLVLLLLARLWKGLGVIGCDGGSRVVVVMQARACCRWRGRGPSWTGLGW
jgi:hypothetical protein